MAEGTPSGTGILVKMDSTESRWISGGAEVVDSEPEDGESLQSEEEDAVEQRLIRTGPQVDSFDVEALDVPGALRNDYEDFTLGRKLTLALQTLGVVFGDVGTSPLYTFDVMFNKSPIRGDEDILGALSLVLYTLILIPLVKYVLVVLWANDDGEGGTFALYSLICRHAKVSLLPNQQPSDARISSFRLKVPSAELERSLKIKERLESSLVLKKLLLVLVLFGTSMVIAVGVVTPAMSVLSAVNGLKVGISGIQQETVVMISVAFLVILFSIQRFGTSKVGLALGPALFVWFCSLGIVGIYNLLKYETRVLEAFNPIHIFYFFRRNSLQAWMSLGGCLLCVTGSEAMFADLCYFSVKSVQLTFIFLVLPSLLLGYLGQAAFLMANQSQAEQVFFFIYPKWGFLASFHHSKCCGFDCQSGNDDSHIFMYKTVNGPRLLPRLKIIHTSRKFMGQIYIPVMNWFLLVICLAFVAMFGSINEIGNAYGIAELGVMMVTTVLVTIIMLLIWQINIVVVLSFLTISLGLELLFFSSVLGNVGDGSWVLLVFAAVLFMIMYVWNYGSKLKYETEVRQKLSMDLLVKLGPNLGTVRGPGIGLVYNELVRGVPAIFGHFLTTLPAIHSMIIFVCIKYVPVPAVPQNERFLFRRVCSKSYHMFRCIARYGYKDVRKENHQTFEQLLIESLEKFIRREAQERSLESDEDATDSDEERDDDEETFSRLMISPNGGVYSLQAPLLSDDRLSAAAGEAECSSSGGGGGGGDVGAAAVVPVEAAARQSLERELSFIRGAKESGVVYLLGHGDIRARKDSWFLKKLVINYFYAFLRKNCRRGIATLSVPHTNLMQVGMTYMV